MRLQPPSSSSDSKFCELVPATGAPEEAQQGVPKVREEFEAEEDMHGVPKVREEFEAEEHMQGVPKVPEEFEAEEHIWAPPAWRENELCTNA